MPVTQALHHDDARWYMMIHRLWCVTFEWTQMDHISIGQIVDPRVKFYLFTIRKENPLRSLKVLSSLALVVLSDAASKSSPAWDDYDAEISGLETVFLDQKMPALIRKYDTNPSNLQLLLFDIFLIYSSTARKPLTISIYHHWVCSRRVLKISPYLLILFYLNQSRSGSRISY